MDTKARVRKDMRIAIMGYGVTGRSAVRFCLSRGAKVLVSDSGDARRLEDEHGTFFRENEIFWEAGGHTFEFLQGAELVIVSPGIDLALPLFSELARAGIPVVGELAVAAPLLDLPVAAITGTNGKTTVTALLGHVLREAGRKVFVGGNIGTPLLDYLREPDGAECMVLEVSSFQLEKAGSFSPQIGLLLNVTPDHIDRHGTMERYAAAKSALFAAGSGSDLAILNGDDPWCRELAGRLDQQVLCFGRGADNAAIVEESAVQCGGIRYDLSGTALMGWIGAANAAAVILAAGWWGVAPASLQKSLGTFVPAPHRLQEAGSLAGVTFVDDSKATNTGAVIAALSTFSGGVHLIAGGRHKGEDYRLLRDSVAEKVRRLLLIGEAADQLATALEGICPILRPASFEEAVRLAWEGAQAGDTVLLSPACASFDMFRSYGHRGEVFTAIVRALIDDNQRGEAANG